MINDRSIRKDVIFAPERRSKSRRAMKILVHDLEYSLFCIFLGMPIYREESVLSSSGTVFRSWGWTSSWIPPYSRALAVNRWWTSSGGVMIPLGEVYWCGKINHSEIGSVKSSQAKSKAAFLWFSINAFLGTWFNILKPLITMDLCQPKMVSLPNGEFTKRNLWKGLDPAALRHCPGRNSVNFLLFDAN